MGTYHHPSPLLPVPTMVMYDTAGRLNYVLDAGEGTNYYGGTYDTATNGYWFRLTRHIQNLIDNDTMVNRDLYILATNPLKTTLFTNRAVIKGTNRNFPRTVRGRMRLKIIYTPFTIGNFPNVSIILIPDLLLLNKPIDVCAEL